MKKFRFFLSLCLIMVAATASAQFANGSKKGSSAAVNTDSYQRFYVSYNPLTIKPDKGDDTNLTGFTFGFTKGISISKSLPLFVEAGARLNYGFKSETADDVELYGKSEDNEYRFDGVVSSETKMTYMGVTVPVNLAYKWTSSSSSVSIIPFVGLTFKGNIIAKTKTTGTFDGTICDNHNGDILSDGTVELGEIKKDYFDKKDVGKDGQWKRFQVGWQIGVGVDYKQLYVGFHYGSDFNEVCKKVNTSNWGVSLGFNF